jgi:sigma-B regulation protein RsbU (phosphoserine phosphatase)
LSATAPQIDPDVWKQLSLVRTVSAQIASVFDLDKLAHCVTELIGDTFQYYYVALFIPDSTPEVLRCWASHGPHRPNAAHESPPALYVRPGEGIVGHVAQSGRELLANEAQNEPHYRHVDALPETQAELALPLKIEDRVLGVLDVQSDTKNSFQETDLLVLRALADNVAIAMEHARLCSDLHRRADQFSAVARASRAVASILDLETLFQEIVTLIHRQFGYPFVHLYTVDSLHRRVAYRAGSGERSQVLQIKGVVYDLDAPTGIIPWVARRGETVLANDVSREPRYRPSELPPAEAGAELAVPLIFGDEVLGVLDIQSERPGAFDQDDRFLFEALADSIAVAVRNANLYHSERWRRQVADSLREVAVLLSADVVLEEVLNAILVELERALPCDIAAIWLLDDGKLEIAAVRGHNEIDLPAVPPDVPPWLAQAMDADQPIVRPASAAPAQMQTLFGLPPDHSAIAVPLRAGDRRLGLLVIAHREPDRYGAESQSVLSTFASYAAVAIENTRLYQTAQEQALISEVMLQVAKATQSLTTLDQVLNTIVQLAPALFDAERCIILLQEEGALAFVAAASYGLDPDQQSALDQWHIALGDIPAFDELCAERSPIVACDAPNDDRLSGIDIAALGFESLLMLPLLAQGIVLGAMLIDCQYDQLASSTIETPFDERMAIIQAIAYQAAAAVENAKLREAQQEEAYVSAALLQVAQAVTSFNNLDDILSAVARITPLLVGVERCLIMIWDAGQNAFRLAQAYGLPDTTELHVRNRCYGPGEFGLLDAIQESNERISCTCPSPEDTPPMVPPELATVLIQHPGSIVGFPLSVKGEVLGAMILEETRSRVRSREKRIELMTGIAHQAAIAIQNERFQQERVEREQLEREIQLAREIQKTFIPTQLPDLPGWKLAATWRAARQVAGDFYDLIDLPGNWLGIIVADVADKGMPAALFMALTHMLMRATAPEEMSPAAVLARVNDLLVPETQHGMFVTAFYAVIDLENGTLLYANAGHNPPLLVKPGIQAEPLRRGGMALGVLVGTQAPEHVLTMEKGDCLVLYTDGVTETFSAEGQLFGVERLKAVIQNTDASSAQVVLEAIVDSVADFGGDAAPSDDLTVVVLCRTNERADPG